MNGSRRERLGGMKARDGGRHERKRQTMEKKTTDELMVMVAAGVAPFLQMKMMAYMTCHSRSFIFYP